MGIPNGGADLAILLYGRSKISLTSAESSAESFAFARTAVLDSQSWVGP